MKILIAGYGTVGKAHETYLKPSFDVEIYDPWKGYKEISNDVKAVIICTATPSLENGACLVNSVYDVISRVPNVPILIKSTISLEGWKAIKKDFADHDITFSPEFLRNKTATEDLANSEYFMLAEGNTQFWSSILVSVFGKVTINLYSTAEELILVKYFRNSFLANKVAFFNQVYDLCKATGVDYKSVAEGIGKDKRIGPSHTEVTDERGFGGHCFPKDVQAIIYSAKQNGVDLTLLKEALEYNEKIRRKEPKNRLEQMESLTHDPIAHC